MHADALRQAIRSHMPQLDGLRGLAILWVIFHNAARDGTGDATNLVMSVVNLIANMGWMGVQMFFVLSGFLITGILLDGRGAANQFRNFYARRTLRIFPVYYAFLFMILVILPWMGLVNWGDKIQLERVWSWTYLINWLYPFHPDAKFPHLWSLAVEEQYYLLWPLLVIFLRKRTLAIVCAVLIVTAIVSRAYLVFNYDPAFSKEAMYYFTFARWDTLASGSLLAILVRSDRTLPLLQRYFTPAFVLLTLVILIQIGVLHNFTQYFTAGIFNQTTSALWFSMLILLSIVAWGNHLDVLRPTFSNSFLRWVGKYSYAMYLFHFPYSYIWLSHFALTVPPDAPWYRFGVVLYNFVGITALSIATAYLSWHVLENPFLKLKRFFVTKRAPGPASD